MEALATPSLPQVAQPFFVAALWTLTESDSTIFRIRARVLDPQFNQVGVPAELASKIEKKHQRVRTNMLLSGVTLEAYGTYNVVLESFEDGEWRECAKLPFGVEQRTEDGQPR